jgi:hypothetical protein
MADHEVQEGRKAKRPTSDRMAVRVKADEVRDNEDGTFTIAIAARPLSEDDINTMRRYFPTLFPTAIGLLHKEVLLQAVVTDF